MATSAHLQAQHSKRGSRMGVIGLGYGAPVDCRSAARSTRMAALGGGGLRISKHSTSLRAIT
eukprot:3503779-Pyramimonas_sp.AAC.1